MVYLSPEGVVFGADSTASINLSPGGNHYFNHNQKLFELGSDSTLAVITWGLGGFGGCSYRTAFAEVGDDLEQKPAQSVKEVADRLAAHLWANYQAHLPAELAAHKALAAKPPFGQANGRTEDEEKEFEEGSFTLVAGFCVGGHLDSKNRTPAAFEILLDPLAAQPQINEIPQLNHRWWGAPNIITRMIFGFDNALIPMLLGSGKWQGTPDELVALLGQLRLSHPVLPIRDAVDFVHGCIYSTIKAMKFSALSQICGGPIEIAVITTDRKFRWVRHKEWDAAIMEGEAE